MPALEDLVRKLASRDPEERREAAVDLGRIGREALPHLFAALGDADWRVRKTAVEALVVLGGQDIVDGLIRRLFSHENAGMRNSSIEALVRLGAGSVDAVLAALDTTDADVRKFLVDILGDIRDTRAVPALIAALNDEDENIGVAAAEALGRIGDRRAVDPLIATLARSDRGWLDYAAAEALGEIGDERALGPLLASLGRSSLREPVLKSLGKIGDLGTLAPLVSGLADPLRIVREVSAVALQAIYQKGTQPARDTMILAVRKTLPDHAVEHLEELIASGRGELQKAAIAILGWAGNDSSVEKLLALLTEEPFEDPVFRALATLGERAHPLLLRRTGDENALVRKTVARVLGETAASGNENVLIGMLDDENGHVRSAAAESLGRLRCRAAVIPILRLLEDEYQSVQESAIEALAAIGDDSVLDGLLIDFGIRPAFMRRNIARLLGRFSGPRTADALSFALKDEEPEVRTAVVHALSAMPGDRALRPLLLAITDDVPEVRMLAAEALGNISASEAQEALVPLLKDADLWVRAAAARSLGRIGGEGAGEVLAAHLDGASDIFLLVLVETVGKLKVASALPVLLALAGHADPEVRKTVITALASYAAAAVRQTLIARLDDPHWSVRKTAVEVLGKFNDPAVAQMIERLAQHDADPAVRQAAENALGR